MSERTTALRALERTNVKPILFSGAMIRALLDARKTQTRRVLKPQPFIDYMGNFCAPDRKGKVWNWGQHLDGRPCVRNYISKHVHFAVGDLLWVRETWQGINTESGPQLSYRATPDYFEIDAWNGPDEGVGPSFNYDLCPGTDFAAWGSDVLSNDGPWRPAIHMPRWASRLTLEVTGVKVERLQDISEEDALAEGFTFHALVSGDIPAGAHPIHSFRKLWDSLNAKRPGASWADNPWIAAITFRPHKMNVDAFLAQREAA